MLVKLVTSNVNIQHANMKVSVAVLYNNNESAEVIVETIPFTIGSEYRGKIGINVENYFIGSIQ